MTLSRTVDRLLRPLRPTRRCSIVVYSRDAPYSSGRITVYQSSSVRDESRASPTPPRSSSGMTRPSRIVVWTIAAQSPGRTRPYQTVAPDGRQTITLPNHLPRQSGVTRADAPVTADVGDVEDADRIGFGRRPQRRPQRLVVGVPVARRCARPFLDRRPIHVAIAAAVDVPVLVLDVAAQLLGQDRRRNRTAVVALLVRA